MVDDADDVGVGGRERVGEGRRAVLRAVVDRDDLERVGQGRQGLERLVDEALEVGLFVVGREEVGQARDSGGAGAWVSDIRGLYGREPRRTCARLAGRDVRRTPAGDQPGFRVTRGF